MRSITLRSLLAVIVIVGLTAATPTQQQDDDHGNGGGEYLVGTGIYDMYVPCYTFTCTWKTVTTNKDVVFFFPLPFCSFVDPLETQLTPPFFWIHKIQSLLLYHSTMV
jgi:hypothetical protein